MSLKKLKRRLSWTFRGRRLSTNDSISELAEHLTIDEHSILKENGKYYCYCSKSNIKL